MDKKRIILAATIAVLLIVTVILLLRDKSQAIVKVNPAFKEYISGFTSGIISTESTIKVQMANDYADSSMYEKAIEMTLFDFSPSIDGKAYWIDSRTVEFRPDNKLEPNTLYTARFYISKLINMPDSLKTFVFQFHTAKQAMEVIIKNQKAYDNKNLKWQKITGVINTADKADLKDIIKTISAKQNGKNLKINIIPESNRKTFYFQIDSVFRGEKAGKVEITYDGAAIGAANKDTKIVTIPSINDFLFTSVRVNQLPEQYVLLQFSDPILEDQDLNGIIKIDDFTNLTYVIEDNEIRVYLPYEETGELTLTIEKNLKNSMGKELNKRFVETITFENIKPNIRLLGEGTIMPSSQGLIFPFEAVNLKAIDVKILKIYQNNVGQFLQVNDLAGQRELSRVGKVIIKKTIMLESATENIVNYAKWNRFAIDLSELIEAEPGAIYRVSLSFKKAYSLYECEDSEDQGDQELTASWEESDDEESDWEYFSDYDEYYYDYDYYDYDYYYYDWYGDDDPCDNSYYYGKTYSRNILATDIGLTVKGGAAGNVSIFCANIVTTEPMSNVTLELFDYQNQLITKATSNSDGIAEFQIKKTPHLLVATQGKQKAYLKLTGGSSLSMSMFDVGGEAIRKGIKGFIYGERGVWRPGDSIYLTFILEDRLKQLPSEIPVVFDLVNPRGQKIRHIVKTKSVNGFYDFRTATNFDDPTGNYTAQIRVGGAYFSKLLKIETIKPNRLKIKLDFGGDKIIAGSEQKGLLEAKWLHGAIARNLRATVSMHLTRSYLAFNKYPGYVFDDPSRRFSSEDNIIFDGNLNEEGKADVSPGIQLGNSAPGILTAYFETRVFEEGGGFSIDRFSLPYYPYESYIGLKAPEGEIYDFILETEKNHVFKVANLDANGKPVSGHKIKVDIYKVNWRWWWDNTGSDLADFVRSSYNLPVQTMNLTTTGGMAQFNFKVNNADWGRYFIRVTDLESGHSSGQTVYIDWADWATRSREGKEGASMLIFSADKEKYQVGEEVKLTIPSSEGGRALITIEDGVKVIESWWVPTTQSQTIFSFNVTEGMAPNVYACVSLLQPHLNTANDLPIRLYGAIPIFVEDPNTHLTPVINMPDVLVPEANASITVKEKDGKPMTFTLAVVDEGLLDLTNFKTPDPWNYFYAREALGVRTWDLYDDVIGAYGGELERLLSLGGGDDDSGPSAGKNRANRFKPMVKFFGPFALKGGSAKTFTFKMPQYIGSVRVMVIAGQNAAYGNAEKTVPVKKPLMVLASMPRVAGPDETIKLPVTVFAMEKRIKKVNVKLNVNEFFTVQDNATKTITFDEPGDGLVTFELNVKPKTGVGKVKVLVSSGSDAAYDEVELEIRNPNPEVTDIIETIIEPGQTWSTNYDPVGITGTNKGTIEISSIPPINLEKRLKYLLTYPYGCIEQTTSSVFPQLYISDLLEVDEKTKATIEKNIKAGITRILSFQTASGGLSYWPGGGYADEWATTYAGHFMLEAKTKGYNVSPTFIKNWQKYQKRRATAYSSDAYRYYYNSDLLQAYRLYTLALSESPEAGAMNLLREQKNLSISAKWRLAAAYQISGNTQVATLLVNNVTTTVKPYREMYYTYGSDERDQAMIIEALCLLNQRTKAAPLVKELSSRMSKDYWMSTQTTAFSLIAISKFLNSSGTMAGLDFSYALNNSAMANKKTNKSISTIDMELKGSAQKGKLKVKNNSKGIIYARVVLQGVPSAGNEKAAANNMKIEVSFKNLKGIPVDISKIEQGTDFYAEVTLSNPGIMGSYSNVALSTIFPSGWEIHNTRMDQYSNRMEMSAYDYIDFRDDRVYTFFSLQSNTSKTYRFLLNASYLGKFYLPAFVAEAMYDNSVYARNEGQWVEVVTYRETANN